MFCITSAVSVLGAYKPCPLEACCFRLALFCSLLFWTCRVSILHQNAKQNFLGAAATHPPRVKSIGWTVLGIIIMQTEIPAFIREKNMFSPLPPKEGLLPKLRSSKNGIRTSPNFHSFCFVCCHLIAFIYSRRKARPLPHLWFDWSSTIYPAASAAFAV